MDLLQHAAAFVTDFADQAVILPAAALIAVLLASGGWRRGALAWSIAIVGTFALMLVLKLGFGACGHLIGNGDIESPSGHTAAAGVFYGGIFAYLAERLFGRTAISLLAILIVVVLVGVSRVVLGAHTVAEAIVGALVGSLAALMMVRGAGPPPEKGKRLAAFLLPACLLIVLLHGIRLPAEAAIRHYADETWPLSACRR